MTPMEAWLLGILATAISGSFGWLLVVHGRTSVNETNIQHLMHLIKMRFEDVIKRLDRLERVTLENGKEN